MSIALSDIGRDVRGEHARAATRAHKSSAIAVGLSLKFEEECKSKSPADLLVLFAKEQAIGGTLINDW